MKTAIATVSISGDLAEKLAAIAAAGFDGVEIFENDFVSFDGGPAEVGRMIRELGLVCTTFQPFRDFEGLPDDARARAADFGLTVRDIPSPGWMGEGDEAEPASYMNFAICNDVVVVPTYGSAHDEEAVAAIGDLFPGRVAVGLRADAVLTGGGSFHCASQHVPAAKS